MKTSIDISQHLFTKIKKLAQHRKTSVRALIEEGLRLILSQQEKRKNIKPKILTFGGDGLTASFREGEFTWERVRDEIYRGQGA